MKKQEKIRFDLSVAEIAYLIRLLVDEKIILNRNKTEVLRIVCENCEARRAETISINSIRNKYNIPKSKAVKDISEKLKQIKYKSNLDLNKFYD